MLRCLIDLFSKADGSSVYKTLSEMLSCYHIFSIKPPGGLIGFKHSRGRAYWRGGLIGERG